MLKYTILLAVLVAFAWTLHVPVPKTEESEPSARLFDSCLLLDACYQNRRYYFEPSMKRKRDDAGNFCKMMGMSLVSIDDCAENVFITNFIKKMGCTNDHFWTSGYQNITNTTQWFWGSSGQTFNFTNWKVGEPTVTKDAYCVLIRKDYLQWKNDKCTDKNLFICESNTFCNATQTA